MSANETKNVEIPKPEAPQTESSKPKATKSNRFRIAAFVAGGLLLAIVIFAAGVSVGFHKARFSYQWSENYERNFGDPHMNGPMGTFMHNFGGRDFRNAHGLVGTIISITDNNIVVKDRENKENTVSITDKTVIKKGPDDMKITDLKNDQRVIVLGRPGDNGAINADLVRVFAEPISDPNQPQ